MEKALVLFSGGLDSRLVVKILQQEKLEILALYFKIPFGGGCGDPEDKVKEFCRKHKVKLKIQNCTKGKLLQEYLSIIRKPKYSRGKGYNPCIDCKIFMFERAKKIAQKEKIKIIATGEVLGERPMSQMLKALKIIEKDSGLKNNLLRPLSAKLLPETIPEKKGLIEREHLYDIKGRKRDSQLELAKKFKIDFPTPGGGCILCEKQLKNRFQKLLKKEINQDQAELIKIGRHFLIKDNWIVLGRNQMENEIIESKKKKYQVFKSEPKKPALINLGEKLPEKELLKFIEAYATNSCHSKRKNLSKYQL